MPEAIVQLTARMSQINHTHYEWISLNPILLNGEIGIETDTSLFKIGDGVTPWNNLLYYSHIVPIYTAGSGITINNTNTIEATLLYDISEV